MTPKQQQFVREYLIDLNATQAAIRAGYAKRSAGQQADDLLKNPEIAAAVQQGMDRRAKRTDITADRVLTEIAHMAFYDPADIASKPMSGPGDIANLPESVRRAIVGWGWDKQGNFTLKLSPKTPALDQLGRHLKLFTDVVEHKGLNGLSERLAKARERAKQPDA